MIQQLNLKHCVVGVMTMNGVIYAVLMVQLLAWTSSAVVVPSVKCIESERQALLSLKRGFNVTYDDWLSSWGDGEQQQECCIWEGIKCSNVTGHVIMLDLHVDPFDGMTVESISPSLGELHHLKYLDLSGIHFTHPPSIPPFIGSLTFLTHLNLSRCYFAGNIPPQLGNLLFLEYLDLSANEFDDPQQIPSQFSNLSHLVYLDLSFNDLVGFPLQLTNMSSLKYLDLSYNSLNETMPPQLGNFLSLEHLDLSENAFTGTIPSQFKNLSHLQHLDLHPEYHAWDKTKSLSSDLQWLSELSTMRYLSLAWVNLSSASNWQQQVSTLSHLQYLDLYGCNLVDSVLTSSLASTSLSYVDISHNSLRDASLIFPWLMNSTGSLVTLRMNDNGLTGTIPKIFGELSSLKELNLANNELKGQIPLSLFDSCNLVELHLSKNHLTGEFHEYIRENSRCAHKPLQILDMGWNEITGMVSDLSQLQSLEELRLGNNRLNGSIHEGIGQLSNLTELSLGNNFLKGLISEAHFSRLSNLDTLDLSHNALAFNVSVDWIPPFNLTTIYLARCKLGPDFPTWLHTQTMIDNLDISCAGISRPVPNWFWDRLPQMLNLNISHNHFRGKIEGPILPGLGFVSLLSIDLSFNLFEGPILAFLTAEQTFLSNNRFSIANPLLCANSTQYMRFMDFSNNDLRGELSDCWRGFESLEVLDLSNNQFYGNMPKSLGSLRNIQSIHFEGNDFSGEIPSSLHNCSQLQVFDVAGNKLSGTIPTWIGDSIPKLLILSLHSNNFHGNIPLSMCNLHELYVLDISLNILSGNIPKCISNLSAMATQANSNATITHDYHYNLIDTYNRYESGHERYVIYNDSTSLIWKGKMSKYGSTLGLLRSIDFSSNRLTGEIPTEMMTLIGLVSLNLSRNFFSGHIPPTIGQLKSIDFLDLSRNHLSGRIPSQLAQIDRLSVLDLSYNDLSGEIPLGTQLQTRDASAYAGNPKLCGAPLNNTCPIHGHQIREHVADGDDEQLVSEGFYIAMAVGFVMAFWGVSFSLILKKSWRYAYFKLLSDVYDKLYVFTAIKVAKFKRFRSQI
ncbi:receptor-like protein EIX2 isoform X1 [Arachis duranensis]|uniref:Receptor-like protein EIX2 isoform X1 n=1 Tax=Arachis duranensis TaxID=130453 RepID=A0A6P4D4N7_ARADU|nr:receptor-like protein EIX2 isoform X1 [Arachis duranensis]XP_052116363.1 receptor-like protein EIX2 isoform X1 [Arachis duranensis]